MGIGKTDVETFSFNFKLVTVSLLIRIKLRYLYFIYSWVGFGKLIRRQESIIEL